MHVEPGKVALIQQNAIIGMSWYILKVGVRKVDSGISVISE